MDDYQLILLCLVSGYVFGISTGMILGKKEFASEHVFSVIFSTVWLAVVLISFTTSREIPTYFNIIGAGATGNISGLNLIALVKAYKDSKLGAPK